MSTMIILMGSVLGFFAGIGGFFLFGLDGWTAVTIWAASGPLSAVIAIGLSVLPQQGDRAVTAAPVSQRAAETA